MAFQFPQTTITAMYSWPPCFYSAPVSRYWLGYLHWLWKARLPLMILPASWEATLRQLFPSLLFSSILLVSDSAHLLATTVCSLARYTTYLQPTVQGPQVSGGKGGVGYINWYKYWIKRGSLVRLTSGTQNAFCHKALQRWMQHSASLVLKITSFSNRDTQNDVD